jgi:hypothetical protein
MKKILIGALAVMALAGHAWAGNFTVKNVPLVFIRSDAGVNTSGQVTVSLSDGNHPAANRGVAIPAQDTSQAINIEDHWWRRLLLTKSGFPGTGVASDSVSLGTLYIKSTSSTVDTIHVFRDTSVDGFNWTAVDSAAQHISSPQWAAGVYAVGVDSLRLILTTRTNISGITEGNGTISMTCYPGMSNVGVSGMGIADVRFIRFRFHLSAGDFVAAGTTGGITASFSYPVEL